MRLWPEVRRTRPSTAHATDHRGSKASVSPADGHFGGERISPLVAEAVIALDRGNTVAEVEDWLIRSGLTPALATRVAEAAWKMHDADRYRSSVFMLLYGLGLLALSLGLVAWGTPRIIPAACAVGGLGMIFRAGALLFGRW
jgi:hypothetical protein